MLKKNLCDFPGDPVVKNSLANIRRHGFNPWSMKIPHAIGQPSPVPQLLRLSRNCRNPHVPEPMLHTAGEGTAMKSAHN